MTIQQNVITSLKFLFVFQECSYDSKGNNDKVVGGGLSSNNEMCQALILYYPSTDSLLRCWSRPEENEALKPWNIRK